MENHANASTNQWSRNNIYFGGAKRTMYYNNNQKDPKYEVQFTIIAT